MRFRLSTGCLVLLAAALAAPSPAQSLAEAAEKEKKRRTGKVSKVFTNDDLGKRSQGAPAPEPSASASPERGGMDESDERRAEEASWRGRIRAAHAAVQEVEAKIAEYEAALKGLAQDMQPNPPDLFDPARLNKREAEKAELRTKLEAAEAELEVVEDRVHSIEEEARREGVPPGWLRER